MKWRPVPEYQSELRLIERVDCPLCGVEAQRHCRNWRGWTTKIWPWHEGSAGPRWVHVERRDKARREGLIT